MGDNRNHENGNNFWQIRGRALLEHFRDINPMKVSLKIAGIYCFFGVLWILLSDTLLVAIVQNIQLISFISMYKGILYVIISGLIIYRLVYRSVGKIKKAEGHVMESYQKLQKANDDLTEAKSFSMAILEKMLNAYALHQIILDEEGFPCDYKYVDVNPAFEAFTGIKAEDIIGKRYSEIIPNKHTEKTNWVGIYGNVAMEGVPVTLKEYTSAFDKWVLVNAYCPREGYFITVFSDITDIKKKEEELQDKNSEITSLYEQLLTSEEELRQQFDELYSTKEALTKQYQELETYQKKLHHNAYHDLLTGLPNRFCLYEKMGLGHHLSQRIAMLFIDSDNFKLINDTMGHSFGDKLIIEIGKRLSSTLTEKCSLYRLGGDEFILCYHQYDQVEEVSTYADEIIQAFQKPFILSESVFHATISIGIALYPEHGQNPDELLQSADIAMYEAKLSGKNRYTIYHENMKSSVFERMNIEKHLRTALDKKEFVLHYQPQLDIQSGSITGFEALIRWNSPDLGFISPLKFISIAEETQLIIPIGKWVIQEACRFIKELLNNGGQGLTIAVNISIIQLLDESFVASVLSILEENDLAPHFLELEITESVLMESYHEVIKKLCCLKEAGVRIALDDFGRGYSSLSHLKQLPLHTLKIDKSFIDGISSKNPGDNLTGTILVIGRKMGLSILAEGVELEEQMEYLKKHKCHKIQGYLISKPLPQIDAIQFYKKNTSC